MLSKKVCYFLFAFIITFNLFLRYPNEYEIGGDTLANFALADSIIISGNVSWMITPLSFIGIYPFSVCSGGLVYLSSLSLLTQFEMQYTILFFGLMISSLGCLSIFILTKEITNNFFMSFTSAIIFSSSKIFLAWTSWNLSFRGSFIALLPILIYLISNIYSSSRIGRLNVKYIFIALIFLICLTTIHKMFFYLPITLLSLSLIYIWKKKIQSNRFLSDYRYNVILLLFSFACFVIFSVSGFSIWDPSIVEYQKGLFFNGEHILIILFNMSFSYAMSFGILIPFSIIGLVFCTANSNLGNNYISLIFLISPFLLIMCDDKYVKTFLTPFMCITIGIGLVSVLEYIFRNKRAYFLPVILFILIGSAILPSLVDISDTSLPETNSYSDSVNTGHYAGTNVESGILIFGKSRIVAAYSQHYTWSDGSMDLMIYDVLEESYLDNYTLVKSDLKVKDLLEDQGSIWENEDWALSGNYYPGKHKKYISDTSINESRNRNLLSLFDTRYVITYSDEKSIFYDESYYSATFINSLNGNFFEIYRDGTNKMYLIPNEI